MKSCFPLLLMLLVVPLGTFGFCVRAPTASLLPASPPSALFYANDERSEPVTDERNHVIFRPATTENTLVREEDVTPRPLRQTAFVLMPGCAVDPLRYKDLARSIQDQAAHPVWVTVPKVFLNLPNPLNVPSAIDDAVRALHSLGFPSDGSIFVGGHSLGGIFLPQIWERLDASYRDRIAGTIHVGSFVMRQTREDKNNAYLRVPRLTVVGDLDGLVRPSRIAEDIKRHVLNPIDSGEDATAIRLDHSVVLIQGMNHFQMAGTREHVLIRRDLAPEISREESTRKTASTITNFMEVHRSGDGSNGQQKESLLRDIEDTEAYLRPLLEAMELEGNHHLASPCNLCEDDGCDLDGNCYPGSPWVEQIQQNITPDNIQVDEVSDQFRRVWYLNPFADPPFYHPQVKRNDNAVEIGTVSEAVYEKPDFFFDGGFFSNTAVELKAKLNSPQAIWDALGVSVPFKPRRNACSKMNEFTIQHAINSAPDIVRERYLKRGIKLQVGRDIVHSSGPAWIWSHLDFSTEGDCGNEDCRIIDSHTMSTPLDHPVPFAGGKLYCKLLSPARVLEWMYTDSLRQ